MDNNVAMLVGTGSKRRLVKLQPIHQALDENLTAGLIGFHAFTGSDTTERIAGKGKQTCWKIFKKGNKDILKAFAQLGQTLIPSTEVVKGLEEFVCLLFAPKLNIKDVGQLRWHLFKKKVEAEKLPPTKAALTEHILRAHYQAMIWLLADAPNLNLPSSTKYGWNEENNQYMPKVSELPPAPTAVIELVKCGCGKSRCLTEASACKKHSLACTELCACDANIDNCANPNNKPAQNDTYDSTDDEAELNDMELQI